MVLCEVWKSLRITQNIPRGEAKVNDACYGEPLNVQHSHASNIGSIPSGHSGYPTDFD
jgi:hypothetical protein